MNWPTFLLREIANRSSRMKLSALFQTTIPAPLLGTLLGFWGLPSGLKGAVAPIPEFTLQLQVFWFLAAGNSPLSGVAERVGTLHTLAPKLC
jgi:hypothetical protein